MFLEILLVEELTPESLRSSPSVQDLRNSVTIKMNKKWSCPACEYQSGRGSNVARHISRKHGDYDVPVLTEFRHTDLPHQAYSQDYSDHYFPHPRLNFAKKQLEKKKKDSFISSYKFEDKKLGIYKKFLDAQKLPQSDERI